MEVVVDVVGRYPLRRGQRDLLHSCPIRGLVKVLRGPLWDKLVVIIVALLIPVGVSVGAWKESAKQGLHWLHRAICDYDSVVRDFYYDRTELHRTDATLDLADSDTQGVFVSVDTE